MSKLYSVEFAQLVMWVLEHSTMQSEQTGLFEVWRTDPVKGVYLEVALTPQGECDLVCIGSPDSLWYLHSDGTLDQVPF